MALTDRQRRFVEHYVALGNATRAAIAAGYKDGPGIREQASRLLTNVDIREAVDERQANLANELGLTRQFVLEGLRRTYVQAIEGAPKVDKDGDIVRGEDGEPIREWSPSGANKALELIGKAHGMWVDRAAIDLGATVVYTLDLGSPLDDAVDDDPEG